MKTQNAGYIVTDTQVVLGVTVLAVAASFLPSFWIPVIAVSAVVAILALVAVTHKKPAQESK